MTSFEGDYGISVVKLAGPEFRDWRTTPRCITSTFRRSGWRSSFAIQMPSPQGSVCALPKIANTPT